MKFGSAYSGAISLTPEDRERLGLPDVKPNEISPNPTSPAEEAVRGQEKLDWLASPVTSALLKDLGSQTEDAINEAIKLAVGFSSHQNPWRIIQLLNKANELRNLIHRYGRNTSSKL